MVKGYAFVHSLNFIIGPILGSLIDRFLINSVMPLSVGYLTVGLIAILLMQSTYANKESKTSVNVFESESETG